MGILQRDKSGAPISIDDPDYHIIGGIIKETARILFELNSTVHDVAEIRTLFSRLTGVEVDKSFILRPPFYADFGRNIRIGKNVFVNHGCTFMDRGGIVLEDDVLIAPKVNLVTLNHLENPAERRTTVCAPITVRRNAWIGLGATVLPGVTIGDNAIVAAAAVVSRDVPPNTMVAGIPAKSIRAIASENVGEFFDRRKGTV
ncbi:MAG: sugar O-acetyltransferase [Planctomycetes bacterium]|nr:sugar O-acetyltransferase [Planctomycetota bacterium]MCD7895101.1 hypothetical protein [Planctomycetaceae bacterium]